MHASGLLQSVDHECTNSQRLSLLRRDIAAFRDGVLRNIECIDKLEETLPGAEPRAFRLIGVLLERHIIAPPAGSHASAVSAYLGRRGYLNRNQSG